MGRGFSSTVKHSPSAFIMLLSAVNFELGPSHEIVILGRSASEDTKVMLKTLRAEFLPNKVTLFIPTDKDTSGVIRLAPYATEMSAIKGKATAYVCRNYSCLWPTTDTKQMLRSLGSKRS